MLSRLNKATDASTATGRYIVNDVRVDQSGKRTLQAELDSGSSQGLTLRHVLNSGKHDVLLVVWDTAP